MEFKVEYREGFLELVTSGDIDPVRWDEIYACVFSHPSWVQDMPLLANHLAAHFDHLQTADVQQIARHSTQWAENFGKSRVAICVARDLDFGLTRMWEAFISESLTALTRVFRDRDQAIAWLHSDQED